MRAALEGDQGDAVLDIDGVPFSTSSAGFAAAIERAYIRRRRPKCLCGPDGLDMYVARLCDRYVVKRMPGTGSRHAPGCPSFEPPVELSGLRQVLGSAIVEDTRTGMAKVKLAFSLSNRPKRATPTQPALTCSKSSESRTRLSLRGLLHYLWDQAELTRWHPGFEGRRSWGTVRRQLLRAADQIFTCGDSLAARLYIPEPFSLEQQDQIRARRRACWASAAGQENKRQRLVLLIAEVKVIMPGRNGHKAVIKHIPDVAFALDDMQYHQLARRFEQELALWSASDSIHLIVIATLGISAAGLPHIAELCLMPVTAQWLPVETIAEQQLVEGLVRERRAFSKVLRYNLSSDTRIACLALTDRGAPAPLLFADGGVTHPLADTVQ